MIERLLIANRGEIACRILRTCRRLGIAAVTLFTEVDRNSLWVEQASEAFWVGETSYLDAQAVLEAARRSGVQAIHPGFGFLAENADFAEAVEAAGLIWIGPRADSMRRLADKGAAKQLAESLGVPVLPGYRGQDQSDERLAHEALQIGFPLMIKAAAGGGGKGMRRVVRPEELALELATARSEALRSFGNGELILERALSSARHIEVQILGDGRGGVIHLGERDCSLQRRHQKIFEEAPAPGLSEELRTRLHEAALRLARGVGYRNAGTVEFLVEAESYYFLEMNTRLQVEHPVTEEITGLDLVELQIRLALGEPLPSAAVPFRGHALEVRLYAEDRDYLPSTGPVLDFLVEDAEVRVETGLRAGDRISPYYDPMVAKLIVRGEHRAQALRKLRRALERTSLLGVHCNRDLLLYWATHEGPWTTSQLDEAQTPLEPEPWAARAAVAARWGAAGSGFRNGCLPARRWDFVGGERVEWSGERLDGMLYRARWQAPLLWLELDGHQRCFRVVWDGDVAWVASSRALTRLELRTERRETTRSGDGGWILAPLTGTVLRLQVQPGETVDAGQVLLHLEAMKMEHRLSSPWSGRVAEVLCDEGQVVDSKAELIRIEPSPD